MLEGWCIVFFVEVSDLLGQLKTFSRFHIVQILSFLTTLPIYDDVLKLHFAIFCHFALLLNGQVAATQMLLSLEAMFG